MRTLNLSGIKHGDSPLISISHGALTAGPYQPPAWGVTNTGGTITIEVDRTTLQCAPDSVRFSVDLSASTLDTAGPTGSEVYDARLHDLIYLWDFGDTGTWAAPVNVLASWKNRNTAKGPFVAHMYTQPGTYNPSVLVIEPSSGKTATASVEVIVANPDTVYAGTKTICVNPVGDSDFAGKPSGAAELNADALRSDIAPWTTTVQTDTEVRRVLFKRGGTFDVNLIFDVNDYGGLLFGAYGTGDDPIINTEKGIVSTRVFYANSGWSMVNTDFRIQSLDVQGNFDPVTMQPHLTSTVDHDTNLFRFDNPIDVMVHDVSISGMTKTSMYLGPSDGVTLNHFHADDVAVTNFGGQYCVYFSPTTNAGSTVALTGCRIAQNPDAMDDPNVSAALRCNHHARLHMRGCDWFVTDNSQPVCKFAETPEADGMIINVHSSSFEGGSLPVSFGNNSSGDGLKRTSTHNLLVDGVVVVGSHRTRGLVACDCTGLTLRNSLLIQPAGPRSGGSGLKGALFMEDVAQTIPSYVLTAPIRMYNCTFACYRDSTDNGPGGAPILIDDRTVQDGGFANVAEYNNVLHMPQLPSVESPTVPFAPLTTDVLWTPRNIGWRDPATPLVLDTDYASAADTVADLKPGTGSSAIGTATTDYIGYSDVSGTTRTAPADKGAWEAA